MAHPRTSLGGARGWTTVLSLTALLTGLVVVQLPSANADARTAGGTLSAAPVLPLDERTAPRQVGWPTPPTPQPVAAPAPPADASVSRAAVVPVTVATDDLCSGDGWEQRRGEAALASLSTGAERTGFQVTFAPARSGYMGLTHLQEQRIDMYVRSCAKQSDDLLRHVMAHELGHAWDTTHLTDSRRSAYQAARGIPAPTDWYGCSGCTDFATPAGDFAEVYAQWARGASSNRSQLAGDASPAELAALAAEFFGA